MAPPCNFGAPRSLRRRTAPCFCALVAALSLGFATTSRAQFGPESAAAIRVQPSETLFTTLCAVYAAGYPGVSADLPPQLRTLVTHLQMLDDPTVAALREFYRQHRLSSPAATLSQFISFAMVAGPPPNFEYVVTDEGVPPDVGNLEGFQKLLGNFYTQEGIDGLWSQLEPYYDAQAARLRGPVSEVVTVATAYTRRMTRFEGGRSFTVIVAPLVGPVTNFRIYSQRYQIAVDPAAPGAMDEIRHAFLYFLLDPLPFNHLGAVDRLDYLQFYARKAPRLSDDYKYDFVAFTDACFVRAVDLHIRRLSPAERDAELDGNDRDGYVLVRPLYQGLDGYDRSQVTLDAYFPTLLKSIDLKLEGAREAHIAFAPAGNQPRTPAESEGDRVALLLEQGNEDIGVGRGKDAAVIFGHVLKLNPRNVRAKYGLAVASAMSGQGALARQLFEQIVESPPDAYVDPSVMAWSHIYLGRISDLAGRRQEAVEHYRAALDVKGLPDTARQAAVNGMKQPFTPGLAGPDKSRRP